MKLSDLLSVTPYTNIELHCGYDGKLVATKRDSLQNYGEVEVLSVYAKIHTGRDNDFASPFLYVYGDSDDIKKIKKGVGQNEKNRNVLRPLRENVK